MPKEGLKLRTPVSLMGLPQHNTLLRTDRASNASLQDQVGLRHMVPRGSMKQKQTQTLRDSSGSTEEVFAQVNRWSRWSSSGSLTAKTARRYATDLRQAYPTLARPVHRRRRTKQASSAAGGTPWRALRGKVSLSSSQSTLVSRSVSAKRDLPCRIVRQLRT